MLLVLAADLNFSHHSGAYSSETTRVDSAVASSSLNWGKILGTKKVAIMC
jgi:hypothetical protein